MHDERRWSRSALERVRDQRISPAIYAATRARSSVEAWQVPGEPVPFDGGAGRRATSRSRWAPPGARRGHHLVPGHAARCPPSGPAGASRRSSTSASSATGPATRPRRWSTTSTARPLKGVDPRNQYVPVANPAAGGEQVGLPGRGRRQPRHPGGRLPCPPRSATRLTAGDEPLYTFARADLAVLDEDVWHLDLDIEVLRELMPSSPSTTRAGTRSCAPWTAPSTPSTSTTSPAPRRAARAELADVLARPAHASAHTISGGRPRAHRQRLAVAACARPSARRPAPSPTSPRWPTSTPSSSSPARRPSSTPGSRQHYPEVCGRHPGGRRRRASGRPVGGMWVEADGNLPGGEALARQLVHGKRFFLDEFGVETQGVWLPDSFGYTAAYPQLARLAGNELVPHPEDLLEPDQQVPPPHLLVGGHRRHPDLHPLPAGRHLQRHASSGEELAHAVAQLRREGRRHPLAGCRSATATAAAAPPARCWSGPAGCATWRARRRSSIEHPGRVLRQAARRSTRTPRSGPASSTWSCTAPRTPPRPAPSGQPAQRAPAARGRAVGGDGRAARAGLRLPVRGARPAVEDGAAAPVPRHPAGQLDRLGAPRGRGRRTRGWPRSWRRSSPRRSARCSATAARPWVLQHQPRATAPRWCRTADGRAGVRARCPRSGAVAARPARRRPRRPGARSPDACLDNGLVRVEVDEDGLLASVRDLRRRPRGARPGARGNLLQLHTDLPNHWDAWDIDQHYQRPVHRPDRRRRPSTVVESGPLVGAVRVDAVLRQGLDGSPRPSRLRAGSRRIDVETEHRLARGARRSSRRPSRSTCTPTASAAEIQFGHVHRPTHTNTSWEAARFEVYGHRWVHVGEPGYGVALLNDSTYGHDVTRTTRDGRRHDDHGPAQPGPRAAHPRPRGRPGHAPLHLRAAARRDASRTPSPRATRSTCRCGWPDAAGAARAAGRGRRRRRDRRGGQARRRPLRRRRRPAVRVAAAAGPQARLRTGVPAAPAPRSPTCWSGRWRTRRPRSPTAACTVSLRPFQVLTLRLREGLTPCRCNPGSPTPSWGSSSTGASTPSTASRSPGRSTTTSSRTISTCPSSTRFTGAQLRPARVGRPVRPRRRPVRRADQPPPRRRRPVGHGVRRPEPRQGLPRPLRRGPAREGPQGRPLLLALRLEPPRLRLHAQAGPPAGAGGQPLLRGRRRGRGPGGLGAVHRLPGRPGPASSPPATGPT